MGDVESRLRRLEDESAIRDTITKYGQSLDYGFEDDFIDCFVAGAVLEWPDERFVGKEELRALFKSREFPPVSHLKHGLFGLRVAVEGDRATALSTYFVIDAKGTPPLIPTYGTYRDVLRRCSDGAWRIEERIVERAAP
jgi:hypothetical protein